MAASIKIERGPSSLTVTQSWSQPVKWFLLLFSIPWNLIVFVFLLTDFPWFILIHAAAGVGIFYFAILLFVNKTVLRASNRQLSVKNGPLPSLSKDRELEVNHIAQLFLKRTGSERQGKHGPSTPVYGLAAKLDTGVEITLMNGFKDPDQVRDLERTIEDYLGIHDEAVPVSDTLDLQPLKDLLPARWAEKVEMLEEKSRRGLERERNGPAGSMPAPDRTNFGGAQPLPVHDVAGHFPLYRAAPGAKLSFRGKPVSLEWAAQADWSDSRVTTARQLRLKRAADQEHVFLYAEYDGSRWNYLEERRLSDLEAAKLGFTGPDHLVSFTNGEDKFYPREEQEGIRYVPGVPPHSVVQFVYFTVRSKTQFRALRPTGAEWEVYVQEAVDSGDFDEI